MAGGIFCDLEKASDSVSLLSKLTYYGIIGKAKLLFESCLGNRYQRVNSNLNQNTFSKWAEVKHGVPQGLILGLLLFFLYVND